VVTVFEQRGFVARGRAAEVHLAAEHDVSQPGQLR
jgi:hypothetical protein